MTHTDHAHLKELEAFFSNQEICRHSFQLLTYFAIRLAARGYGVEVLAIVQRSAEIDLVEPLVNGLRLHLGQGASCDGDACNLASQIANKISEEVAAHADDSCLVA